MTADKERTKPKVVVENFMVIIIMIDSGGDSSDGGWCYSCDFAVRAVKCSRLAIANCIECCRG